MTVLTLITHAHTQAAPAVDARGWALSAAGEEQASVLAQQPFWPSIDQLVLSSEPKTALTVQSVTAQRSIPVQIDARFDELKRGGWVGDYGARVEQAFAEPDKPADDWESARVALDRFLAGITDLRHRYRGQRVVLVGHGLTFSLYRAYLLGQSVVDFTDWQRLSFAAVATVELKAGVHGDPLPGKFIQDFTPVAVQMDRGKK